MVPRTLNGTFCLPWPEHVRIKPIKRNCMILPLVCASLDAEAGGNALFRKQKRQHRPLLVLKWPSGYVLCGFGETLVILRWPSSIIWVSNGLYCNESVNIFSWSVLTPTAVGTTEIPLFWSFVCFYGHGDQITYWVEGCCFLSNQPSHFILD